MAFVIQICMHKLRRICYCRFQIRGTIPSNIDFTAMALIICAGVTVYKGLKGTEAKPGEWVVISGIGGLGHLAVQYAKAMGLHVAAIDISDDKLQLAKDLGADLTASYSTLYKSPLTKE